MVSIDGRAYTSSYLAMHRGMSNDTCVCYDLTPANARGRHGKA